MHAIGDLIQSVGVAIAGALIWWQSDVNGNHQWQLADPICTFLFSILVLATTWGLIGSSVHVLMEGTPEGCDPEAIGSALRSIPNVTRVHELHIWSITVGVPSLSVHLETPEPSLSLQAARALLADEFGITHVTIQTELPHTLFSCADAASHCAT